MLDAYKENGPRCSISGLLHQAKPSSAGPGTILIRRGALRARGLNSTNGSGHGTPRGSGNGSGSVLGPATATTGSEPAHRGCGRRPRGADSGPLEPSRPPTIP